MRSAQKQEVLELIESLHQAHEEIKEALSQKKQALAQNMIAECQEFAYSLGENIERLECQGHVTVSYVEAYCETLFHIHEEVSGNQYNENKIYKVLKKQFSKLRTAPRMISPSERKPSFCHTRQVCGIA